MQLTYLQRKLMRMNRQYQVWMPSVVASIYKIYVVLKLFRYLKVDLTWDETDQDRLKVTMNPSIGKRTKKGKGEVKEEDFKAYLASSSEDEDDDKGN